VNNLDIKQGHYLANGSFHHGQVMTELWKVIEAKHHADASDPQAS
jgi:hypothetical protein